MDIGIGLYVKRSDEAVKLYTEAFGLTLGYNVQNPDGTFFHSELYRGDKQIVSVVESSDEKYGEKTAQVSISCDTVEEVQKAYEVLCKDGIIDTPIGPLPWSPCAASVIDKFGVWWYISALGHKPPDDYEPFEPWEPAMYKKPE